MGVAAQAPLNADGGALDAEAELGWRVSGASDDNGSAAGLDERDAVAEDDTAGAGSGDDDAARDGVPSTTGADEAADSEVSAHSAVLADKGLGSR